MANPQLLSGARGLIQRLNVATGEFETIAFATDINVNERQAVRPTYVVGRMNAAAIDSLTYDVDVSIGRVIPVNAADAAANANATYPQPQVEGRPAGATALSVGLEPIISTFVASEDLTIALQDKVTGSYISAIRNCRFAGRSLGTNANDIATERLNFIGIYDTGVNGENAASQLGYEGN